jgi:hypothetical protein
MVVGGDAEEALHDLLLLEDDADRIMQSRRASSIVSREWRSKTAETTFSQKWRRDRSSGRGKDVWS